MSERQAYWQNVYTTKGEGEVSWFQDSPAISIDLIKSSAVSKESAIVDVGGGASRLVDHLLKDGFRSIAVLDLSSAALETAKSRLGSAGADVEWITSDVTTWRPRREYDVWHDRAAFHFLTDPGDRRAYIDTLKSALRPNGQAIIATFALDGPEKCSGLPVQRYDASTLQRELGEDFRLIESRRETHTTPWDSTQSFQFARFVRV
jgi:2-polyprenyl-3-methyl-5-hydroxy-6-metoxy-1,4-benzoquinol methylase